MSAKIRQIQPIIWILLLALILRTINIAGRNVWYDEAFAVLFAEKGLDAMLYGTLAPVEGGASDIHPLLYYSTLNIWMAVFGQSAAALRLWSVLLGLATVYALYRVGRELFGEKTGLAAALVMALASFHVQYSQEIRMYSLMALLLTLATWCFIRAYGFGENAPQRRMPYWIGFGVLAGLAMYTQQLSAFYLMSIGLVPFAARNKRAIQGIIIGTITALLVYLPWLVNIPSQLQKVNSYYWVPVPNLGGLILTIRSFFTIAVDFPPQVAMAAALGALFLLLFLAIQVVIYLRKPRRKSESDRGALFFVLWMFAGPILLMWLVSQIQPVYLDRALIPSAVMLYLALGWLLTRSGAPRPILALLSIIGIGLFAVGLFYQTTWDTFPNSPFREAAAFIRENQNPGDVVIHMNKLSALPMIYYDRDLAQRYLADAPGSPEDTLARPTQQSLQLLADSCIQSAGYDARRIWFVVFDRAEGQYEAAGRTELREALSWLDENFGQEERFSFNDLHLIRYADSAGVLSPECE